MHHVRPNKVQIPSYATKVLFILCAELNLIIQVIISFASLSAIAWIDLWMKLAGCCDPAVLWACAFLSSLLSHCVECAGNTWWFCFCCFVR